MVSQVELHFRNSRGQKLCATAHEPQGDALGAAVVCHGMLSNRGSLKHIALCDTLAESGFWAMRFDFAGRGQSEGRLLDLSYSGQVEDLRAAVTEAKKRTPSVALVGSSMGGAVALLYAATDPAISAVAAVATVGLPGELSVRLAERECGISAKELERRLEEQGSVVIQSGLRLGRSLFDSAKEADVLAAAGSLQCPLLVVHGSEDAVVPVAQALMIAERAPRATLRIIDGGDHVFSDESHRAALLTLVRDFCATSAGIPSS